MSPSIEMNTNLTLAELQTKFFVLQENMDFFFVCVMGIIISFMQIGFGYLECGAVNSKNATNVMFKNMMDSLLCGFVFWLIGYTIAFGEGNAFMGLYPYQGGKQMYAKKQYSHFFFQLSYASTPSTITSGAVVDRISLIGYITYSSLISGVVYPIVCHWVWTAEGWLNVLGFKDFCGSSALHLLGGSCAIAAAIVLGPRINRFPKPGYEHTLEEEIRFQHHSAPMSGLGGMIIYTGFFAFNGGSVLHISKEGDGEMLGKIMGITWLASSGAAFGTLLLFRSGFIDGKPRWSLLNGLNAGLSGMASVCAHCDAMDLWGGLVSGLFTSLTYCFLTKLTRKLKIDDPIDVIAVHFGGGLLGTIGTSVLRYDSFIGGYGVKGGYLLGYQIVGAICVILFGMACTTVMLGTLKIFGLLRVTPENELLGSDITKHKEPAYIGITCACEYYHKKHDIPMNNSHRPENRNTPSIHPGTSSQIASYNIPSGYFAMNDLGSELQQGLNYRQHVTSANL